MNAIEKYTNDKFIRLLNSFLKKICEPSFKKEYGEHIKLTLYGVMVKSKSLNTSDVNSGLGPIIFSITPQYS